VVNCIGILMASRAQSFERFHARVRSSCSAARRAGVRRVVQCRRSASRRRRTLATPYLHSKLLADDALAALPLDWAVLRPSLVYGPRSQSAALFATLASLPVMSLPGRGAQRVQPIHVYELAEAITRLVEQPRPARVRASSSAARRAELSRDARALPQRAALGDALWLPLPMPLMRSTAHGSPRLLPQKVLLPRHDPPARSAAARPAERRAALLGRAPSAMAARPGDHSARAACRPARAAEPRLAWRCGSRSPSCGSTPRSISALRRPLGRARPCWRAAASRAKPAFAVLVLSCALNLTLPRL
jgi:hypothetical protein